jgi:hypothetical protein
VRISTIIRYDDGTAEHIGIEIDGVGAEDSAFARSEVERASNNLREVLLARKAHRVPEPVLHYRLGGPFGESQS